MTISDVRRRRRKMTISRMKIYVIGLSILFVSKHHLLSSDKKIQIDEGSSSKLKLINGKVGKEHKTR